MSADVSFVCPNCQAISTIRRQDNAQSACFCLQCHSHFDREGAGAAQPVRALIDAHRARTARIRLYWFDGFASEYPDPIDKDTRAVSLDVKAGRVVLHASSGVWHRFDAVRCQDVDGFAIFREQPSVQVEHRPPTSSGPRLPPEERFDYFAVIPAAGGELDWHARSREDGGQSTTERRLVGN